jgi:hypothetical protein
VKAIRKAKSSLEGLRDEKCCNLADNVTDWLLFLQTQIAQMTPPEAVCTTEPGRELPMFWDHAFRAGEHSVEDFQGFFKKTFLARESKLAIRIRRTPTELVVAMRERDIDPKQRLAQWERYRGSGSDCFVERVYVDVDGKGRDSLFFIVWPGGASVSLDTIPGVDARTEFTSDATSTETTVRLPFKLLGKRPKKGDVWRLNVTGNPAIARNHCFTWSPQYDANGGNPYLFGKVRFE